MRRAATQPKTYAVNTFHIRFEDVSLDRLKTIIDSYLFNYNNIVFVINRKPSFYQLDLTGDQLA